jgi:hypothetical protein
LMYFAQPGLYAQGLKISNLASANGTDPDVVKFAHDLETIAPPDTPVFLADLRYQLVVGRGSLVAYLTLTALTLAVCLGLIAYNAGAPGSRRVPKHTTSCPTYDIHQHCTIGDDTELQKFPPGRRDGGQGRRPTKSVVEASKGVSVRLATG